MKTVTRGKKAGTQSVSLAGRQRLVIQRSAGEDWLTLQRADGQATLRIQVTAEGPVLHLDGPALTLQVAGDLTVDAERVAIHGRKGVSVTSGGDATLDVAGGLEATAQSHDVTATRGNVNVRANDDVALQGERVLLNC